MTILVARAATRWTPRNVRIPAGNIVMTEYQSRGFCQCMRMAQKVEKEKKIDKDPRVNNLGRAITDDFATIRENYGIFQHC